MNKLSLSIGALALMSSLPARGTEQIILDETNIVGASSVYFIGTGTAGLPFDKPTRARVNHSRSGAGNIFNSQISDSAPETFLDGSYWISRYGVSFETFVPVFITPILETFTV